MLVTARRALGTDDVDLIVDRHTTPRRAAATVLSDAPVEFTRPRRVALPSIEEDAIVPLARCVSAQTTMTLPVINVDAVHAAKSSAKSRRRISLPAAAVALTSAIGLGATLLPQTVSATPTTRTDATQATSVTRDATRSAVVTTDLSATSTSTTPSAVADNSAKELNDSFASLGKNAAQKLTADQAAAAKLAAEQAAAAANAANAASAAQESGKANKTTAQPTAASNAAAQAAVNFALSQVGKPYVWGASGPSAYDCSGLTMAAYRAAGITIPRVTYGQMAAGTSVSQSALMPGDLVFFYGGEHVGIYIGNGQVVHAADVGIGVIVSQVSYMPFAGATRVA